MHRRQFMSAAVGALLHSANQAHAMQDPFADATPASPPQHHGRPRPIVLSDGIELVDYRLFPSEDVPRIIGEISSTRDDMVDSPVISIVFPELGEAGLAYAPSFLPVMRPGESNMVFGVLPERITSDEDLQAAEFGLCSSAAPGEHSALESRYQFRLDDLQEERWESGLQISGTLQNDSAETAYQAALRGIVRDANDRIAGCTPTGGFGSLAAGEVREFVIRPLVSNAHYANPFRLVPTSSNYSIRLQPGLNRNQTADGCPALFGLD